MNSINETLIRDVVQEVLGRLGRTTNSAPPPPLPGPKNPACPQTNTNRRHFGVFQDAKEACAAAQAAFEQLQQKGVGARRKIVEIIKGMAEANAENWGKLELEETKIGRLDHKIEKLKIIKARRRMAAPGWAERRSRHYS
jgi:aldehyde dehydrogenase